MKIFANHAHVFRRDQRADGTVSALLEVMDKTGIEKCVCFAPFYEWGLDYNPNLWMAEELKAHPELTARVVDIHGQDLAGQVKQIRELGLKGIKLHPAFQKICDRRTGSVPGFMRPHKKRDYSCRFIPACTGIGSRIISRCCLTKSPGIFRT